MKWSSVCSAGSGDCAMKRKKRIWIYVLLLLLAAAAAVVIWQWKTIRTVHAVVTTDKESAAQQMEAQSEKERELLEQYEIAVTPPTMQQRDDLIRGKLSAQELMEQLGLVPAEAASDGPAASEEPGVSAAEDPAAAQTPASSTQSSASSTVPEASADPADRAQALIEDCVRRLYVLEVDLLSQLGSFRQDAVNEWNALDKSERTSTRKISIALDGLDRCEELERQSDADVRALLDACRSELEALGASTEIIDELWNSYAEEKETTKTYFLSQYA